jgi:5-carboxymethyl-2-hydroxymuconate isomerase
MPHCILEYTDNIADAPVWSDIFKELHAVLVATGEWHSADIKSRAIALTNYYIGNGKPQQAFVTLSIQILAGRSDDLKKSISESCLKALVSHFPLTLSQLQTSITVQIVDIHQASYCRRINYEP